MQEVSQVLAGRYPQVNNNLSNSDNDSASVSEKLPNLKHTNTKSLTLRQVRGIAYKVEETLGEQTPSRIPLYCSFIWKLPESTIWANLEQVQYAVTHGKSSNPQGLFVYLCQQALQDQ